MGRQHYEPNGHKYSPLTLYIFMITTSKMFEFYHIFKGYISYFHIVIFLTLSSRDMNIYLLVSFSAPTSRIPCYQPINFMFSLY